MMLKVYSRKLHGIFIIVMYDSIYDAQLVSSHKVNSHETNSHKVNSH